MRRNNINNTYKKKTRDIIDQHMKPWQLSAKDERDGIHRLVNKVVSLSDELNNEIDYVENMFFPDRIDLSEEWVIYKTQDAASANDIYYSGNIISTTMIEAESIDDFMAGHVDVLTHKQSISGLVNVDSIVSINLNNTHILNSGIVTTVDIIKENIISTQVIDNADYIELPALFDTNHDIFRITDKFDENTLTVTDKNNKNIPYSIIYYTDLTGLWNPDFDINNDGVIWNYEKSLILSLYGLSMKDVDPDEWALIAWADVDNDGKISDKDKTSILSAYPSALPDTYAIISVPESYKGIFKVRYIPTIERVFDIYKMGNGFNEIYSNRALSNKLSRVTYDYDTEIYYGPDKSNNNKKLRAVTYSDDLNSITGDELIYTRFWNPDCKIIDIDIEDGILYLLVTDGVNYKIIYDDIKKEYVESINNLAEIELPESFFPEHISVSKDGYILLGQKDRIEIFHPTRDRFIEINGVAYFNRKKNIKNKDGELYEHIPVNIFNNMDSFAYSFGIDRPWGCDNIKLRNIINDFYKHPQGHDYRGTSYGISREIGYIDDTVVISGVPYLIPNELTLSGNIKVNNIDMDVISSSDNMFIISGDIGLIIVRNGNEIIPYPEVSKAYSELNINGFYRDNNGDVVNIEHLLKIEKGKQDPLIKVNTLGDREYLKSRGYIVDNNISDEFEDIVKSTEEKCPFIYKNAIPNKTTIDIYRLSEDPLLPTSFNPNMDVIQSGSLEYEVQI